MRFRLFRMPTGFPSDPVGLDADTDAFEEDQAGANADAGLAGAGRWSMALGTDNPYFDFRTPGDPGGVGFYKVQTQYQLYASDSTQLSFNLQAATPAGLESDGVAGGPTILTPAMAYFYQMEGGAALQAFVGKHVGARAGWSDSLERSVHYGCALQRPLADVMPDVGNNVYVFVEALGHSRLVNYNGQSPSACWQLVPGLHWRVSENCWMSGGILIPLKEQNFDPGFLQLTCSWRF
jgi:hypothetical protein